MTALVAQWRTNNWRGYTDPEAKKSAQEAEEAILTVKEDAIPFLLDLMAGRESALRSRLRSLIPRPWHAPLHLESQIGKQRNLGAVGLAALGTNAAAAVPTLIELTLAEMRRTPADQENAYLPVFALGFVGQAAEPAIPILIQCLTNKYEGLQLEAALRLGQLGLNPEAVVPALISFLETQRTHDGNSTRCAAINSLRIYGSNASQAAPLVSTFLTAPDSQTRESATNFLYFLKNSPANRP